MSTATLDQPPIRHADSWQHQLDAYWFVHGKPAAMLAMAMGTGKSKVAVDLLMNWGCQRVLVLCPVSVRNVWRREFERWAPGRFPLAVLEKGTVKRKTKDAADVFARMERLALVCNYESAWREPLGAWILSQTWDCVICDEIHRIKGHASRVSRFAGKLRLRAKRRLGLTGTPMAQGPLDIFAQYRFLDSSIFSDYNPVCPTSPTGDHHYGSEENHHEV